MTIRPYRPSDVDTLIALFQNTVRTVALRDYTHEQVMAWAPVEIDRERWATRFEAKATWVAEIDGVTVGFSDLEPDGHIDTMFVHADYQRRGVATALVTQVEASAVGRGITRLYTEASITACLFFERRGFRVVHQRTVSLRGQRLTNYAMEKRLT